MEFAGLTMTEEKDLRETVEQLAKRVEDVEEENEQLRDRVDALEDERDDLQEELAEEREERERVEEIARAAVTHSQQLWSQLENEQDNLRGQIEGVHARISAVIEEVEEAETGDVEEAEALLPIQQLGRMPEHVAEQQLNNENHRNSYRARSIWKDFREYADRTPAGWVLRSGRLQRVLKAQSEETHAIETWTAKRVMQRLVEFSNGVVEREKKNGEWMVVLPEGWQQKAEKTVGAEADAAVTPGG
jgi:predicted nuclease with TOPRIM domain